MKALLAKLWRSLHLPKDIQLFVMRFFGNQFLVGITGIIFNDKKEILTRTDRHSARLDMCYLGIFIGVDFIPSSEVSQYGFFSQNNLPLLRQSQVFLINQALSQHI